MSEVLTHQQVNEAAEYLEMSIEVLIEKYGFKESSSWLLKDLRVLKRNM